jgi:alkylation response protein AidB-like acyl-CoA dehydrogenase
VLDKTPAEALGLGVSDLVAAQDLAMVAQCAETLGAMESAITLTRDYLMTRQQFGRPLATFQVLQHRMADLWTEADMARSAVINAAGALAQTGRDRDLTISASKNFMGRIGRLVAEESIQMHGGIAMTQEYELAHIAKRIVMADHRFGDTDYHLERYIALSAA